MKKGHKRQSGFSWDKQWNGKFVTYKLLGRLFKVAGAADKAGLSKAIELVMLRTTKGQISDEQRD